MKTRSNRRTFRCSLNHRDPLQDLENMVTPRQSFTEGWVCGEADTDDHHHVEWVPESRFDDQHQGYLIIIQLPTVPKESIQIGLIHHTLSVRIDPSQVPPENLSSLNPGTIEQRVSLPEDADPTEIVATFQPGSIKLALGRRSGQRAPHIKLDFR